MFYLLEDNRIIVENKRFTDIYCYENRKGFLYKSFKDKNYGKNRNLGKIKKQSENVFDLIEAGDLVKTFGIFRVDEINTQLKQIYGFLDRESIIVINTLGVKAIYKPNEKGDYIKAWEEKDD